MNLALCLNGKAGNRYDGESETFVAHTLRGEGFDASEDGTGRGSALVASTVTAGYAKGSLNDGMKGTPHNIVPLDMRQLSRGATMTNNRTDGGPPGTGIGKPGDPSPSVCGSHVPAVAFQTRIARNGRGQPSEIVSALTSCEGGTHADTKPHVADESSVRRLTPREYERLQGLPDDFTRWGADGSELSDSARYRMIGNSAAVPVLEWILGRIAAREAITLGEQ